MNRRWSSIRFPARDKGRAGLGLGNRRLRIDRLESRCVLASTVGLYDPASAFFFLSTDNAAGAAELVFQYGPANFTPIAGDWDGDGIDTVGVYDSNTARFLLRNSNSPGPADIVFQFGATQGAGGADYVPIVGDWDGDGDDTVGLCDNFPSVVSFCVFFLRNSNSAGPADLAFGYGPPGRIPVAGDWDGDGDDSVAVYDGNFFIKNTNEAGQADLLFQYGDGAPGTLPIAGNWDDSGGDTVGVYIRSTGDVFLRNTNTPGFPDISFPFGPTGQNLTPITGNWDGAAVLAAATADEPPASLAHRRPPNSAALDTLFGEDEPLA